jgi:aarF domain-containing kinase
LSILKVLESQLGRNWKDNFKEFSNVPFAAASIGQVHKGILKDGR